MNHFAKLDPQPQMAQRPLGIPDRLRTKRGAEISARLSFEQMLHQLADTDAPLAAVACEIKTNKLITNPYNQVLSALPTQSVRSSGILHSAQQQLTLASHPRLVLLHSILKALHAKMVPSAQATTGQSSPPPLTENRVSPTEHNIQQTLPENRVSVTTTTVSRQDIDTELTKTKPSQGDQQVSALDLLLNNIQIPHPKVPDSKPKPKLPDYPSKPLSFAQAVHAQAPLPNKPPTPAVHVLKPLRPYVAPPTPQSPVKQPTHTEHPLALAHPNRMTEFVQPTVSLTAAQMAPMGLEALAYQMSLGFQPDFMAFVPTLSEAVNLESALSDAAPMPHFHFEPFAPEQPLDFGLLPAFVFQPQPMLSPTSVPIPVIDSPWVQPTHFLPFSWAMGELTVPMTPPEPIVAEQPPQTENTPVFSWLPQFTDETLASDLNTSSFLPVVLPFQPEQWLKPWLKPLGSNQAETKPDTDVQPLLQTLAPEQAPFLPVVLPFQPEQWLKPWLKPLESNQAETKPEQPLHLVTGWAVNPQPLLAATVSVPTEDAPTETPLQTTSLAQPNKPIFRPHWTVLKASPPALAPLLQRLVHLFRPKVATQQHEATPLTETTLSVTSATDVLVPPVVAPPIPLDLAQGQSSQPQSEPQQNETVVPQQASVAAQPRSLPVAEKPLIKTEKPTVAPTKPTVVAKPKAAAAKTAKQAPSLQPTDQPSLATPQPVPLSQDVPAETVSVAVQPAQQLAPQPAVATANPSPTKNTKANQPQHKLAEPTPTVVQPRLPQPQATATPLPPPVVLPPKVQSNDEPLPVRPQTTRVSKVQQQIPEVEIKVVSASPAPKSADKLPLPEKVEQPPQQVSVKPVESEVPKTTLNPVTNPYLSSAQVIQAINEGVYFDDIPRFLQEIITAVQQEPGKLNSVNVTLRPAHLGEVTANFVLHENNAVTITLMAQTNTAQKVLQSYVTDMQEALAATQYKVQTIQITAAGSSQQQHHSGRDSGQAKHASDGRRHNNRRRKANDNMTIDVTV